MARTKEDVKGEIDIVNRNIDLQYRQLNRASEEYGNNLRSASGVQVPDSGGLFGGTGLATSMARGNLKDSYKRLYDQESQRITAEIRELNAKKAKLQKELEEFPEYKYPKLVEQKKSARSANEFRSIGTQFLKLNYKDSKQLAEDCKNTAASIEEQERQKRERIEKQQREQKYNSLLAQKKSARTVSEFCTLAKQFRAMNMFSDYLKLVDECEKMAANIEERERQERERIEEQQREQKYNHLIVKKSEASSENDFLFLAQEFCSIENYKDAATLAEQCNNQSETAKEKARENHYNNLLTKKINASSENDFFLLTQEFREMGANYKDTAMLADECEKRYQELKDTRIQTEYKNAEKEMRRLNKQKTRRPDELRSLAIEWKNLSDVFKAVSGYRGADVLTNECIKKSDALVEKAKQIEARIRRRPAVIVISLVMLILLGIYEFENDFIGIRSWIEQKKIVAKKYTNTYDTSEFINKLFERANADSFDGLNASSTLQVLLDNPIYGNDVNVVDQHQAIYGKSQRITNDISIGSTAFHFVNPFYSNSNSGRKYHLEEKIGYIKYSFNLTGEAANHVNVIINALKAEIEKRYGIEMKRISYNAEGYSGYDEKSVTDFLVVIDGDSALMYVGFEEGISEKPFFSMP